MGIATAEAIRDRVIALIEALDLLPTQPRFLRYRNEGDGDYIDWAQKNPTAALRRFQARDDGRDDEPDVSNLDIEDVKLTINILIAYPQTSRLGIGAALDRDDVMRADWKKIRFAIGWAGRVNFSGNHDCTPLGATKHTEQRTGVDIVVIEARFRFYRATAP